MRATVPSRALISHRPRATREPPRRHAGAQLASATARQSTTVSYSSISTTATTGNGMAGSTHQLHRARDEVAAYTCRRRRSARSTWPCCWSPAIAGVFMSSGGSKVAGAALRLLSGAGSPIQWRRIEVDAGFLTGLPHRLLAALGLFNGEPRRLGCTPGFHLGGKRAERRHGGCRGRSQNRG
jgi:hypothetical protein